MFNNRSYIFLSSIYALMSSEILAINRCNTIRDLCQSSGKPSSRYCNHLQDCCGESFMTTTATYIKQSFTTLKTSTGKNQIWKACEIRTMKSKCTFYDFKWLKKFYLIFQVLAYTLRVTSSIFSSYYLCYFNNYIDVWV